MSPVYVQAYDSQSHDTCQQQAQAIRSLSGKAVSSIEIMSEKDSRPAGCVIFSVSASAAVYLHVKGRVDIDGLINQAQKKLERTRTGVSKQRKILSDPKYKEKVSAELQEVEKKKLADLEAEVNGFEETIKQFETLKLE